MLAIRSRARTSWQGCANSRPGARTAMSARFSELGSDPADKAVHSPSIFHVDRPPARGHRHGDGQKGAMGARLRRETPMTRAWIARRLAMGSASYIWHL